MAFEYKTLEELHELLVNKETTSVEIVEDLYKRIEETDEKVGAFIHLNKEKALELAKKQDEQGIDPDNILSGLPVGIKDNIVTTDEPTTAASKMLEGFVSVYDATVIKNLADAGMISMGKLNLDEFAMGGSTENSSIQITRNPWNLNKVPGGSSGGSAAAVAAGQIPAALGTDTGGSVRQPAAFNGIVGMKPTYGRVSRYGVIAFASSLDQVGTMTKTVKDNALLLNAISGHDEKDATSYPQDQVDFTKDIDKGVKGLRIGVSKEMFEDSGADSKVLDQVEAAIEKYKELGAEIVDIDLEHSKYGVPSYYIIASAEASSNLQRFDGVRYGYRADDVNSLEELYVRSRTEGFGDEVERRIMLGTFSLSSGFYEAHYEKAAKARTLIRRDFEKAFDQVDLILTPTTLTPAYDLGDKVDDPVAMYKADTLTITANLAGIPAMSVPCGFVDGMPVGLQLMGNQFQEQLIYRAAYAFEQATDYHTKHAELKGGE